MKQQDRIVECELLPITEYNSVASNKKKFGRYHKTNFWDIKGFGNKKWVVAMKILVKDPSWYQKMDDGELLAACLEYLSIPPPRKKYAKKDPKPKYGVLSPYKGSRVTKNDQMYISALAIVSEKKNKHFWGKGKNV